MVGKLSRIPCPNAPRSCIPALMASGNILITMFKPSDSTCPNASMAPLKPPFWNASVIVDNPLVPNCTNCLSDGVSPSETAILAPSKADWNSVTSPARLSSCVFAIASAAPWESSIASANSSHLSALVANKALTDFKSTLLNILDNILVFSSSVIPSMPLLRSAKISFKLRILPSES